MKLSQDNWEFVPTEMKLLKMINAWEKNHVIAIEFRIMSNQGLQKNRQMVTEV